MTPRRAESVLTAKLVVGITGASGAIYALRLLENCSIIKRKYGSVHVIYTEASRLVFSDELGFDIEKYLESSSCVDEYYHERDWKSPLASSSNLADCDGVIIPASLNTVAKLASGIQDTLLLRAFSSLLRLKRRVVVVVRETPLSAIDLVNLYKLARSGAVVLPASPAFYIKPKSVDDLVNFIVGKVFDVLGVKHDLYMKWRGGAVL